MVFIISFYIWIKSSLVTCPLHPRGLCSFFKRCMCQDSLPSLVLQVSKPSFSVLNLCSAPPALKIGWIPHLQQSLGTKGGFWRSWGLNSWQCWKCQCAVDSGLTAALAAHFCKGRFQSVATQMWKLCHVPAAEQGTHCTVTAPVTLTKECWHPSQRRDTG